MFLKISQNSQENTRPEAYNFIKKETLAQVLSCECCGIFKNIYFTEHLQTTNSVVQPNLTWGRPIFGEVAY